MDGAGDDSEGCAISLDGNATWSPIGAFLETHGPSAMMAMFRAASEDTNYTAWLAEKLEDTGFAGGYKPWAAIPDGAEEESGTLSLMACPLDTSRARALRGVEYPELEEKAKAIIYAGEWRSWDILRISRLPDTTGLEGTFVEDFHQRLCALGALFYVHWTLNSPIPPFLLEMGRRIPTNYLGYASRTVALARAVTTCAALQHGVTHLGWLDIVLQLMPVSAPSNGADACRPPIESQLDAANELQARVLQMCPEYGSKINSWKHMGNICSRVDPKCFAEVEASLAAHGIPKSILPQT